MARFLHQDIGTTIQSSDTVRALRRYLVVMSEHVLFCGEEDVSRNASHVGTISDEQQTLGLITSAQHIVI
jgi:hypothetical protein